MRSSSCCGTARVVERGMTRGTNAVPDGWIVAPLQDVVTLRSERVNPLTLPDMPYIGMEHVEPHTNRIIQTLPASSVTSSSARFWANDVLYGRMRPYLNKVAQPRFAGLASAEFMVFAFSEHLHPNYLRMRLTSADFVEFALGQISGDRPRVKFEQLGEFAFALPPIHEQHRIVEKLEELLSDLDAGVAELRAAQAKLKLYRQSLLKAAVTGELTAERREQQRAAGNASRGTGRQLLTHILVERRQRWETRQLERFARQGKRPPADWEHKYSQPVSAESNEFAKLPRGWTWATLEQLSADSSYGSSVKCSYEGRGEAVLRIPNVVRGEVDISDIKFSTESLDLDDGEQLQPGDILVVRTNGSVGLVGRSAVFTSAVQGTYYFASYLLRLRCVVGADLPVWINFVLASPYGRTWIESRAASSAGQHNISLGTLLGMPVPLPPVDEQRRCLETIAELNEALVLQADAVEFALRQSEAQRKNILKCAFSGQLVPQDPNDEPASVLLERIRASRADKASAPTRRTRKAKEPA
jgi:type I restriction enzyme, S subunit